MNENFLQEEILWCIYCKEEIEPETPYVIDKDNFYHPPCYKLLQEETDPFESLRE